MEEQVQMNEKLRALLEKAKREKKIASKDLIDTLEAIDADEPVSARQPLPYPYC